MTQRILLQQGFRTGAIDKHEYSREMAKLHEALLEYVALLSTSDMAAIEITAEGIFIRSGLAPIAFPFDPTDRGSPCSVALNFGQYERAEFDMWKRLVPVGATIADVGANIGWYSAHMAATDPTSKIVAFEPVPDSFDALSKTLLHNQLCNVVAERLAVSNRPGSLTIYVDPTIAGAASAHPSVYQDTSDPILAPMVTLDDYSAPHGLRFDAIKLDVEGGELAVLQGAQRTLAEARPVVFVEMLRRHTREFGYHPNDIIALMTDNDYRCFYARDEKLVPFDRMEESTVETNFFFLHRVAHMNTINALSA